jgi:hypothetical protein
MDDINALIEDIELYEYFEMNYMVDKRIFYICYPPFYPFPIKAFSKDELFEKVLDVANDIRQDIIQNQLAEQLAEILNNGGQK